MYFSRVCSLPNWLGCSTEVRADQRTVSTLDEKSQTVQRATVEAREYLERVASASEIWHSAWERHSEGEMEKKRQPKLQARMAKL